MVSKNLATMSDMDMLHDEIISDRLKRPFRTRTFRVIKKIAIGLLIGWIIWRLSASIGTLLDFGESNSYATNHTSWSLIGGMIGVFIGGMYAFVNIVWIFKKK